MKLRTQEQTPAPAAGRRRSRKSILLIGAVVLALIAWTGLSFMGGVAFLDLVRPSLQSSTGLTSSRDAVASVASAPYRWLRAWRSDEEVPRLHIDIKFKHLHKLHEKRDEAIALGLLQSSSDDFVPAEIRVGDRTVRVKVRLKGDYTDHLEGEKWSMRVHTRKGDQLFGMRRFSIQAPRTRAFQAEPIVLDHYRREGILAPRYSFIDVTLNGKDIGLMAVEESFGKELLESQRRREGVIVRFHEDPFFANLVRNGIHGPFSNFYVATITPFGSSAIEKSPKLRAQLEIATGLLRGFLDRKLAAHEVFDVDLTGRFMAVSEVWGTSHALSWHNLRFYLNPITMLLEPIAFDINMQVTYVGTGMVNLSEPFPTALLEDEEMREAYIRNLQRIAREMAGGSTTDRAKKLEAPMLAVLNREFPLRSEMKFARLERRASLLATVNSENFALFHPELVMPQAKYPDAIRAYLQQDTAGPSLELINALPIPIIVRGLDYVSADSARGEPEKQPLSLRESGPLPIVLPGTTAGERPSPVVIPFDPIEPSEATANARRPRIVGTYQVQGQSRRHPFEARPYFEAADRHPIPTVRLEDALATHPFLRWDEANGRLNALAGDWLVRGSLVLPETIGLAIGPGTRLRFAEGEALIATGPLVFQGTADAPIVLEGVNDESLWSGVVALRSEKSHDWQHVIVRRTGGIERGGWILTGGVTLRDGPVRIADSLFESNRCEDALNIVRSSFELTNVRFVDTPSDAFDGDFVRGRIAGGSFEDVGGDGIDVSGADVTIEGTFLTRIHDKALSMGEGSTAHISNVRVVDAGTAVASKDASMADVSDSNFDQIRYTAIMAYVKKPEYGPSEIVAADVTLGEVGRPALAQTGSRVTIDGDAVTPEDIDIEELYKRGYMRK